MTKNKQPGKWKIIFNIPLMAFLTACLVGLLPLVYADGAKDPNLGKALVLSIAIAIFALCFFVLAIRGKSHPWRWQPLDTAVAAFSFIAALSLLYSKYPFATHNYLRNLYLCVGVYYLVRLVANDARKVELIVKLFLLGGMIVCVNGIIESPTMKEPGSTWFNRAYLAAYFLVVLPLALWAGCRKGLLRIIGIAASIALICGFYFIRGRVQWLAIIPVGTVCIYGLAIWFTPEKKRKMYKALGVLGAAFVVFQAIALFALPSCSLPAFWDRMTKSDRWDPSRTQYMEAAIRLGLERPIAGWGAGNYPVVAPTRIHKSYFIDHREVIGFAHNEFAQIFAEMGVIGLLAFMAIPITAAWTGLKRIKRVRMSEDQPGLSLLIIACWMSITGFLVANLVDPTARVTTQMYTLMLCYALLGACCGIDPEPRVVGVQKAPIRLRIALGLCALLFVCIGSLGAEHYYRAVRASRYMAIAEIDVHYKEGRRYAVAASELAVELLPGDPEPLYDLSDAYSKMGDYVSCEMTLNEVEKLSPNYGRVHYYRGCALALLQRYEEASEELTQALELDGRMDTEKALNHVVDELQR